MGDGKAMWIAEVETRHTKARGFGATPEEAMTSLVDLWRTRWVPMSGADPEYLLEIREEIGVSEFHLGRAYLIGNGDDLWHAGHLSGSDPRFDGVLRGGKSPRIGR